MGLSGKTGVASYQIATKDNNGTYTPSGGTNYILEVTEWTYEESVRVSGYGHSESLGTEDVVAGTWSARGTVELKIDPATALDLGAGDIVELTLTNAAVSCKGLAVLESIPISTRIDGGEPVSSTYRWRSKLDWTFQAGDGDDGN